MSRDDNGLGSTQVDKNLAHEEIELGEKLHPHPRVKFQIHTCTRRGLGAHSICKTWIKNK
jgi:hypothetical protein